MLKTASTMLIVVALSSIIIGIVYISKGSMMDYHEEFAGMTMKEIAELNPNLATLATVFIRLAGTLFVSAGVSLIAIIHYGLKRGERWAWWATLIGMGVVNGPMVAITEPVGGFPWRLAIIMLTVFVIAISVAGKQVFGKKPPSAAARVRNS